MISFRFGDANEVYFLNIFLPVCNYSITVEVNERVTVPTHTHMNPLEPETGNALGSIGTNESVGLHYLT